MVEKATDTALETERLILRKWRASDIEPFMEHLNTRNVMRWLGGVQSRETFDAAMGRLEGYDRDFGHTFWIVAPRWTPPSPAGTRPSSWR